MKDASEDNYQLQDLSKGPYARPNDRFTEEFIVDPDSTSEQQSAKFRRPSLRTKRGALTMALTAFTIGALMIVISSPYSKEFLAPGPLTSPHARLLAGQGADRCAACHGAAGSSVGGWIADTFTAGHATGVSQSDLCMECHKETIPENFALHPHNVAPEALAEKTSKFKQASFSKTISNTLNVSPVSHSGEIACSACHREHKGNQDLTALTNAQCQSCHKENYHSFETDHPEFVNWPQASRQKIAFDHTTHVQKHYPSKQTEFNCSQCHIDDDHQNTKVLAPFELSCAKCHEQSIVDSGIDGIAIFSLPMLDMRAINAAELDVGTWPASATGDFDGEIPPVMRMLLMADSETAELLARLPAEFNFSDIDADDSQSVRDAVQLVWATKKLLQDLATNGQTEVKNRLENVLGRELAHENIEPLVAGLNEKAFLAAANRWLPKLNAEVSGKFAATTFSKATQLESSSTNNLLITKGTSLARPASLPKDELLRENPLTELMANGGNANSKEPRIANESKSSDESAQQNGSSDSQSVATPPQADQPRKELSISAALVRTPNEVPIFSEEPQTGRIYQTGWHRDDQSLQIRYRPTQHEDKFLKRWTDLIANTPDADVRFETKPLFKHFTNPLGIGSCKSCHTVEQNEDRSFHVNWTPLERDATKKEFTFFSHGPHLIQPELKDCSHCHELDTSISNAESFASFDQSECLSNFRPVTKGSCAKCHQKGLTSNNCTQCHGYHIGGHKFK
jgi:hypothetical protein